MQITSVHYSHLVNLGNYEHEKVGAWANVPDGEDAATVLAELTAWVDARLAGRDETQKAWQEAQAATFEMEARLRQLKREYGEMFRTWHKARSFLKQIGLEVPEGYIPDDGVPF